MVLIPKARLTMSEEPGYFLADLLQLQVHDDTVSGYVDARGGAGHLEDGPCTATLQGRDERGRDVTMLIKLTKALPEPGNLVSLNPYSAEVSTP